MINRKLLLAKIFYTFFVNGYMVALIGATIPFISNNYNFGYNTIGIFLAFLTFGNIISSQVFNIMERIFKRKEVIAFFSILLPISLLMFIVNKSEPALCVIFAIVGLSVGGVDKIGNEIINKVCVGRLDILNFLHTFFAIGGFIALILCYVLLFWKLEWKYIVLIGMFLSLVEVVVFWTIDFEQIGEETNKEKKIRNIKYYLTALSVFFFVGLENSINGWGIIYFSNSGIMNLANALLIFALMYLFEIIGTFIIEYLSEKRIKNNLLLFFCTLFCCILFFSVINSTNSIMISMLIPFFAIFCIGIKIMINKNLNTSAKMESKTISLMKTSGIIVPLVIGNISNLNGINCGIRVIMINFLIILILSIAFLFIKKDN